MQRNAFLCFKSHVHNVLYVGMLQVAAFVRCVHVMTNLSTKMQVICVAFTIVKPRYFLSLIIRGLNKDLKRTYKSRE